MKQDRVSIDEDAAAREMLRQHLETERFAVEERETGDVDRPPAVTARPPSSSVRELTGKRREPRVVGWGGIESTSVLAAGLARDFDRFLSVVLGNTVAILEGMGDDARARDELEKIRLAAERAGDVTAQLLAFTRQQSVVPRLLDFNEVVCGMEKVVRPLLGPEVQTTLNLEPGLGCVYADPSALEQIILNLARNARDAMPGGGSLAIETASVVLDETFAEQEASAASGLHLMLQVTDTGSGMDAATEARAFEPFFTTREGRGAGLGLSTVLGLVQQARGSIWIESEIDEGTAITVCLPQCEERPAEPPSSPRSTDRCARTVLLVEEDDAVRSMLGGILRRAGYAVVDAGSSGEALRRGEENAGRIDLLLSDLLLPQLTGRQLAKRIRSVCPAARALFMSRCVASASEDARHVDASAAILTKPVTPTALVTKVREVLERAGPGVRDA